VLGYSVIIESSVRAPGVCSECGIRRRRSDVSCQRAKQATDPFGITFGIINSADIDSTNFLQVIPYGTNRLLPIAVQVARPSSDGDELGDSRYGQFCIRVSMWLFSR